MIAVTVGDPHIRPGDILEGERLISLCEETAIKYKADILVLMGDLTHYHGLVHNSVLAFWKKSLERLSEHGFEVIVLVGNHDRAPQELAHSMMHFKNMH